MSHANLRMSCSMQHRAATRQGGRENGQDVLEVGDHARDRTREVVQRERVALDAHLGEAVVHAGLDLLLVRLGLLARRERRRRL